MGHIWLRAEIKANEQRTPLIPAHAKTLIDAGHLVTVEESIQRVFPIEQYKKIGCRIVPNHSWINAPVDAYILGLKNLAENSSPLKHKHIYFAHAYKNQSHAKRLLSRFIQGNGLLYDLEYLTDQTGNRVAAFGFHAGIAGAAIGLQLWCLKKSGQEPPFKIPQAYMDINELF